MVQLALSIVGTTLLMIDPGDTYVSAFIGPLMSVLLPAHVMYIAIVFALPQMKNITDEPVVLEVGERIVQGVFMPFLVTDGDEADGVRTGGFGSTGV